MTHRHAIINKTTKIVSKFGRTDFSFNASTHEKVELNSSTSLPEDAALWLYKVVNGDFVQLTDPTEILVQHAKNSIRWAPELTLRFVDISQLSGDTAQVISSWTGGSGPFSDVARGRTVGGIFHIEDHDSQLASDIPTLSMTLTGEVLDATSTLVPWSSDCVVATLFDRDSRYRHVIFNAVDQLPDSLGHFEISLTVGTDTLKSYNIFDITSGIGKKS